MTDKDWPSSVNAKLLVQDAHDPASCLVGFPQPGCGDRSLFCDQYERCLTFAGQKNWDGFNCQQCCRRQKAGINFHYQEFTSIDDEIDEDEILFGADFPFDQLLSFGCNQNSIVLTLVDEEKANAAGR